MYWQLNKSAAQKHIKSAERQPLHSDLYWPSCQRRSAQQRVSITTIASVLVAGLSLTYHDHTATKATLIRLILNRAMKLRPVGRGTCQGCGARLCVSDPNYPTQESILTIALLRKPLGGGTVLQNVSPDRSCALLLIARSA